MMRLHKLSREELYELVWSKPASTLAQELVVSDGAITKLCRKLNIPKPTLGHWQKLKAGKKVKRPALPAPGAKRKVPEIKRRPKVKPVPFEGVAEERRVYVSDQLDKPHPMVVAARKALERASANIYGQLQHRGPFDIRVTSSSVDRALRLLDALLKAIKRQRYAIEQTGLYAVIVVGEEIIGLRFKEKAAKRTRQLTRAEEAMPAWDRPSRNTYSPSGKCSIMLEVPARKGNFWVWEDEEDNPLEYRLHKIVEALPRARDAIIASRIAHTEYERQREVERQRRAVIEQKQREEQRRREGLEQQAVLWQRGQVIRAFLAACKARFLHDSSEMDAQKSSWLAWGERYAVLFDPLENGQLDRMLEAHLPEDD
jgi:hypothetical protein